MRVPGFLPMLFLPVCGLAQQPPEPLVSLEWQSVETGVTASFRGVSAPTPSTVWVTGTQGTVLLSTDGGRTFRKRPVPEAEELDFRDVHAVDERVAYLLSAGTGASSRIYKTEDGGDSWKTLHVNARPEGFFNGLAFWDHENGVAVGDPVEGRLFVMVTRNGRDFHRVPVEDLPPTQEGEYGFAASGTNVAVAGSDHVWIATGGSAARVFRSADGGRTWAVSDTPIRAGAASAGIFSLYFRDTQTGFAVGGDYQKPDQSGGNLARTDDGGVTWEIIPASPALGYRSAIAESRRQGRSLLIVAGIGGSDISRDEGRIWRSVGIDDSNALAVGASGIWVVGPQGRVARGKVVVR